MAKKVELAKLAKAAEELNTVLGCNPAIKIKGANEASLIKSITEASALIDKENDEFSAATVKILKDLDIWDNIGATEEVDEDEDEDAPPAKPAKKAAPAPAPKKKSAPVVEDDEDDDEDDEDDDEDEDEPEPVKPLKKGKPAPVAAAPAKKKAAPVVDDDEDEDEDEDDVADDQEEAPKKSAKKGGTNFVKTGGIGIIASIVSLVEKSGKKGISKEEILNNLVSLFPDKDASSMKNTVNVQVPNRISKERFEVEKLENGNYRKAPAA